MASNCTFNAFLKSHLALYRAWSSSIFASSSFLFTHCALVKCSCTSFKVATSIFGFSLWIKFMANTFSSKLNSFRDVLIGRDIGDCFLDNFRSRFFSLGACFQNPYLSYVNDCFVIGGYIKRSRSIMHNFVKWCEINYK